MRGLLLLLVMVLLPSVASAGTFSVSLPDLVGVIDFPTSGPGREASFDLGREFSEVQGAWIEVEAHVFAQQYDVCGTVLEPAGCVRVVQLLGLFARLDKEDSPTLGTVWSDGLSFSDDAEALEAYGVDRSPFNNRTVGWDFLLDGEGRLTPLLESPLWRSGPHRSHRRRPVRRKF